MSFEGATVLITGAGRVARRRGCASRGELAARAWSDPGKSGPVLARMPAGRFAEMMDVAEVIFLLLSDSEPMLNGVAVPIARGSLTR